MLEKLGHWAGRLTNLCPWTNVYGLARSLLAAGTLGTLVFNSPNTLFHPALGLSQVPYCQGPSSISLFCVLPQAHLELARWLAVAILTLVMSGWRPRWTALPHWWIAFSLQVSATIVDGGDQVTSVLTLLLLPIALTDARKWHWSLPKGLNSLPATGREESQRLIANMTLWLIRLQVAAIYLNAAIGKMGVEQWDNGTSLYYWFNDPTFGTPMWMRPTVVAMVRIPFVVAMLTWGVMVLEFLLALGLILPSRARRYLLWAGIALHTGIMVMMGLVSFGLAMFGALVLYLRPADQPLRLPQFLHSIPRLRNVYSHRSQAQAELRRRL